MIRKRIQIALSIAVAAIIVVLAAIPFVNAGASSAKIKLVVDLHGYTPSTSRIATAEDPDVFNSTYYIAEAFMEENPDVEIVWARTKPVGGMDAEVAQWFTTQIAGETVPAIAFSWGTRYQDRDWYLPLDEYLEEDYPYDEKYNTWKDVFRDYLWKDEAVINARGEVVGIPITVYPGAATGYYYNKNLFAKNDLSVPLTWNQLVTNAEVIKQNGNIGVAPWSFFSSNTIFDAWVWGSIIAPSFGGYVKNAFGADYDGNGTVSAAELARATLNGLFSTKNQYAKDAYYLLKAYYTQTLDPAWASIEYYGDWLDGNVGIREEGIWAIPVEASTAKDFDYGVFVAPYVTKDSSYSVKKITSSLTEGETVSATLDYLDDISYSVGPYEPTPDLVVNIMKAAVKDKPEVLDAALRFLKYLTKPDNVSMICIENAGVVGAVKGTGHSAIIDEFLRQKFPVNTKADWPAGFTDRYGDILNRRMEEWIKGSISDETFFSEVDYCNENGAIEFIKKMSLDVSSWETTAKEKLA